MRLEASLEELKWQRVYLTAKVFSSCHWVPDRVSGAKERAVPFMFMYKGFWQEFERWSIKRVMS